jgi:hypothetical protein
MIDWGEFVLWTGLVLSLLVVVVMPCLSWRDEQRFYRRWRAEHLSTADEDTEDVRIWRARIREAIRSEHLLR